VTSLRSRSRRRLVPLALALIAGATAIGARPASSAPPADSVEIIRVSLSQRGQANSLANAGYDLIEGRSGNDVLIVGDETVLAKLKAAGYKATVDQVLPKAAPITARTTAGAIGTQTFDGGYRTVTDHYAHLDTVAATYPGLATVVDYGDSWRKVNNKPGANDLRAICITKKQAGDCTLNPNSAKPRAVLMAAIHARELTTAELAYRYIDELVTKYGTDADITVLLDNTEVWIVPVANPDGRNIVESGGNAPYLQRKNANDTAGACSNPPTASNQFGVDLNRNASYQWGQGGSSALPCDQTYKGTSAASEPEQQALQQLFTNLWPDQHAVPTDAVATTATGTFITVHSYSNLVLLPPGKGGVSANDAQLRALAFRMSNFNGYATGTGPETLYDTTGTTDDWVYANLGPAAFTFEVGPQSGTCSGFTPAYSCVDSTFWNVNRDAFLYAAKAARAPYVTPRGPSTQAAALAASTVAAGTPAALTATVNDTTFGNAAGSFGRPVAQTVNAAEYYVDVAPWAGGTPVPMSASDGSFTSTSEAVTGSIPTTGLTAGRHTIYVRGRNAGGFWGPVSALFLTIGTPTTTTLLSDNFEGGTANWSALSGTATWSSVTDGTKRFQGAATTSTATGAQAAGNTAWANYSVEATAKVTAQAGARRGPALLARVNGAASYYRFGYSTNGTWNIWLVQPTGTTLLASSVSATLSRNIDYKLKATVNGSNLSLSVNSTVVVSATNSALTTGRVGLRVDGSTVRFDDVVVTAV
jgi:carboxypeptidase T